MNEQVNALMKTRVIDQIPPSQEAILQFPAHCGDSWALPARKHPKRVASTAACKKHCFPVATRLPHGHGKNSAFCVADNLVCHVL